MSDPTKEGSLGDAVRQTDPVNVLRWNADNWTAQDAGVAGSFRARCVEAARAIEDPRIEMALNYITLSDIAREQSGPYLLARNYRGYIETAGRADYFDALARELFLEVAGER